MTKRLPVATVPLKSAVLKTKYSPGLNGLGGAAGVKHRPELRKFHCVLLLRMTFPLQVLSKNTFLLATLQVPCVATLAPPLSTWSLNALLLSRVTLSAL